MPTPKLARKDAEEAVEALNDALRKGYRLDGLPSAFPVAARFQRGECGTSVLR